jgi:hypothetical protein
MGSGYSYDILANSAYCRRFDYVPTYEHGRLHFIATSDYDSDFSRKPIKKGEEITDSLYEHGDHGGVEEMMARC